MLPSVLPPSPLSLLRPARTRTINPEPIICWESQAGNLLRGPDPVSKYENSESSSSGQKRDSRRNFAASETQTCECHFKPAFFGWKLTSDQLSTCGQHGGGGASRLPVSPPCLGDTVGAVVPPTLLHAPLPLRLPLAADEYVGGAELLQVFFLHVLGSDPRLLLLPAGKMSP